MQAPPNLEVGNFPCPHCGGELPRTMPQGLVFPCPYCQQSVEAPASDITAEGAARYQQWAMQHGAAAASLADQQYREQHDPANAVFASAGTVIGTVVGGTPHFIGSFAAPDGTWSVRMVQGLSRALVWEALSGSRWAMPPDDQKIAIRGERLFIAIEGTLHCLELGSGRAVWSARLPGAVATRPELAGAGDELMLYDFVMPSGRGVVAVCTQPGIVAAWDRESGEPRWSRRWDRPRVHCVPGLGLIVDDRTQAVFVGAGDGAVLAQWTDDDNPEGIYVEGGRVALRLEETVRIVDGATRQVLADRQVDDADFDAPLATIGGRLLVPINCVAGSTYQIVDPSTPPKAPGLFARFFGASGSAAARKTLPVPKMQANRIVIAGGLAWFDLRSLEGDERRVIAMDDGLAQSRFDSGPLSDQPSRMDEQQIQSDGRTVVYVTAPDGDDHHCELRAVDAATGTERWRLAIGSWTLHSVCGDHLVVTHRPVDQGRTVSVLSLADGSVVARCPFA